MTTKYRGSCHCGAIKFSFHAQPITQALRCNCSMCSRKGAMMTSEVIPLQNFEFHAAADVIGLYQFGDKVAKHYFCKQCGIYTYNETLRMPGHLRVNLGCVENLDTDAFEVTVFDGKHLL